jgi:hypothetical protein
MKMISSLAVITVLLLGGALSRCAAGETNGVALAIVYDTSGSMNESVPGQDGKPTPKYRIANQALIAVTRQIQAFITNAPAGETRRVEAGVFIFQGDGAQAVIPFGPFNPQAIEDWAKQFSQPGGNTPLGNALNTAGKAALNSPLSHKHVLIITDGMNTAGPAPERVLPALQEKAAKKGAAVSVHFIAFDTDAKVFGAVKKQGATVLGAGNETQLNVQLSDILQHKILLEAE